MSQMLQDQQGPPPGPPPGDPGQGLPPELVAAIQGAGQGGPPPGGDPGAGLPPELMAMLQGGGGGAPPDGGQPAGKPGIDDPAFKMLVQKLAQIAAQEPDAQDAAALLKLVGELKKLIGGRQDEGIQAMGGNPGQMRGLARTYGG
jgi:hypothetical protein